MEQARLDRFRAAAGVQETETGSPAVPPDPHAQPQRLPRVELKNSVLDELE